MRPILDATMAEVREAVGIGPRRRAWRWPRGRSGIGPRERWWLVLFLALGSAYFAFLLAERLIGLLGGFGTILLILFLAWLLAFVMSPVVAWLEERLRLPRPLIVIGTYLVALVVSASSCSTPVPRSPSRSPSWRATTRRPSAPSSAVLADWERGLIFGRLQVDLTDLYAGAVTELEGIGRRDRGAARDIAGVTIAALGSLLLIIVLSLYMLVDSQRILPRMRAGRAAPLPR